MGSNSGSESELESFQRHVTDRFHVLASVSDDELLTADWIMKLLEAFSSCQDEFKAILLHNKNVIPKHPLNKMVSKFFDLSVEALDMCNAAQEGMEKIRQWNKHLEIAFNALCNKALTEGKFQRARKALVKMKLELAKEKDMTSSSGSESILASHRNRAFGVPMEQPRPTEPEHSRPLSWCVPQSWSATKQLRSISHSLVSPRRSVIVSTNGLAVPVFTTSFVLFFVLWVIVAAIPCQERGVNVPISSAKNAPWTIVFVSLYKRILEESRKRDQKGATGLLKEIYQMERCSQELTDLVDSSQFPLSDEHKEKVRQEIEKLNAVFESIKNSFDVLEKQIREMYRRIRDFRIEGLQLLNAD